MNFFLKDKKNGKSDECQKWNVDEEVKTMHKNPTNVNKWEWFEVSKNLSNINNIRNKHSRLLIKH